MICAIAGPPLVLRASQGRLTFGIRRLAIDSFSGIGLVSRVGLIPCIGLASGIARLAQPARLARACLFAPVARVIPNGSLSARPPVPIGARVQVPALGLTRGRRMVTGELVKPLPQLVKQLGRPARAAGDVTPIA